MSYHQRKEKPWDKPHPPYLYLPAQLYGTRVRVRVRRERYIIHVSPSGEKIAKERKKKQNLFGVFDNQAFIHELWDIKSYISKSGLDD